MGFSLQAIVATRLILLSHVKRYEHAHLISLPLDFALVPFTDQLAAEIREYDPHSISVPLAVDCDWELTPAAANWLHNISLSGPVAYIEDECHGGICGQASAVWDHGEVVLGPVCTDDEPGDVRAVNQALKRLGVVRGPGQDEFLTLGLGNVRHTSDWLPERQ